MTPGPRVEFTSPRELRALFNEQVWPRVITGQVVELVLTSGDPSPRANQPAGTKSQTVGYFKGGRRIAEAHRYLLKDGTLGGSGIPDPKLVVQGDVILLAD